MVLATWQVGQLVWSMLWFALFFMLVWLVVRVFLDLYRARDIGGWGKALWTVLIIFLPWLGIFAYLLVRGNTLADRSLGSAYPPLPSAGTGPGGFGDLRHGGVVDGADYRTLTYREVES